MKARWWRSPSDRLRRSRLDRKTAANRHSTSSAVHHWFRHRHRYSIQRYRIEAHIHMPRRLTPEIITAAIAGFEQQKERIDTQIGELPGLRDGSTRPTA